MVKKSTPNDYQREIGELKEAISQLNTNVAVMAETMKSLREWMEKDSLLHSEVKRTLESRMSSAENKIDALELDKAKDNYMKERLAQVESLTNGLKERTAVDVGAAKRIAVLEKMTRDLAEDKSKKDGWFSGAKLAVTVSAFVVLPAAGFILSELFDKVFK